MRAVTTLALHALRTKSVNQLNSQHSSPRTHHMTAPPSTLSPRSRPMTLQGGAGAIEALCDLPPAHVPLQGVAIIGQPHPLYGGNMHNKVVQTLARTCAEAGWQAIRFNCRGVGLSAGTHDNGHGEADDMHAIIEQVAQPHQPLVLAGFSFGTFLACQVAQRLQAQSAAATGRLRHLLLVGTAASRFAIPPVHAQLHGRTLVLHGEQDDVVPLTSVLDWARPQQTLPVTVLPGGGHFFHGQLALLKRLVLQHLQQTAPGA